MGIFNNEQSFHIHKNRLPSPKRLLFDIKLGRFADLSDSRCYTFVAKWTQKIDVSGVMSRICRRRCGKPGGLQRMFGVELAAVEQQRCSAGAVTAAFDFTDEDDMVAFFVAAAVEAFE